MKKCVWGWGVSVVDPDRDPVGSEILAGAGKIIPVPNPGSSGSEMNLKKTTYKNC
jgi:hypothetical protein